MNPNDVIEIIDDFDELDKQAQAELSNGKGDDDDE